MLCYRHHLLLALSFILALSLDCTRAIGVPKSRILRGKETVALVDRVNQFHDMLDNARSSAWQHAYRYDIYPKVESIAAPTIFHPS